MSLSPLSLEILEGVRESLQQLQQQQQQSALHLSLVRALIAVDKNSSGVRRIAAAVFKEALESAATAAEDQSSSVSPPRLLSVLPLIPHIVVAASSCTCSVHDLFLTLLRLYLRTNSKLYALTLRTLTPEYLKTDNGDLERFLRSRQESIPGYSAAVLAGIVSIKDVIDWNRVLINESSSSLSPLWTTVAAESEELEASEELILQVSAALLDPKTPKMQKHALFLLQKIKSSSKSPGAVSTLAASSSLDLFTSLYVILDEKQFHIISPVLRRVLPQLFSTSMTSFYVIVLVKLLSHDNRALVREGLTRSLALGQHLLQEDYSSAEEYLQFLRRFVVPVLKTKIGWVLVSDNSAKEVFNQVTQFAASLKTISDSSAAVEFLLDVLTDGGTSQGPVTIFFIVSVLKEVVVVTKQTIIEASSIVGILQKTILCLRSCLRTLEPFLLSRVTGMILEVVNVLSCSEVTEVICDLTAVLPQSSVRDHKEVIGRIARKLDQHKLTCAGNQRGAVRLRLCSSENAAAMAAVIDDLIGNWNGESSAAALIDAGNIFRVKITESQLEVIIRRRRRSSSSSNEFLEIVAAVVVVDDKELLKKAVESVGDESSDLEVTWRLASLGGTAAADNLKTLSSLFLEEESVGGRTTTSSSVKLFSLQMETLRNVFVSSAATVDSEVIIAAVLEKTIELLDMVGGTSGEGLVPALDLFVAAARRKCCCSSLLRTFAEVAWKMLQEARRSDAFAQGLNAFAALIVNDNFLFQKYAFEVLKLGETVLTAPLALVTALEQEEHWEFIQTDLTSAVFVRLIVDGPAVPKASRSVHAIVQEVIKEEDSSSDCMAAPPLACMAGPVARFRAVAVLLKKKNDSSGGGVVRLIEAVVAGLLSVEAEDEGRYFENSWTHRRKQRALQGVLALLPRVSKAARLEASRLLLLSLMRDSPQPSVRYLAEWAVASVLAEEHDAASWSAAFFDVAKKAWRDGGGRLGFGSLFASLSLQTWKILNNKISSSKNNNNRSLEEWLQLTLPLLSELILGNHTTVRVYAQVVFEVMFSDAERIGLQDIVFKYGQMSRSLEDSKRYLSGNAGKILEATRNDFYLRQFHPVEHLQLQVIFQLLPILAGTDEVIIGTWTTTTSSFGRAAKDVEDLYAAAAGDCWHLRNVHSGVNCIDSSSGGETFQRKMVVVPPVDPDEELLIPLERTMMMKTTSLIVVGSLLERTPNLGGLCRTCEVFGVSTFVVPSLSVLQDANFKSLAVSAHNWVNVVQVHPRDVDNYLVAMATEEGYSVVALEQTSNSTMISQFQFPKKTILLLGNEKTGVPASLLNKVDRCVEIPQVGVIRSLNVHVSGAIAIFEFAKQHNVSGT